MSDGTLVSIVIISVSFFIAAATVATRIHDNLTLIEAVKSGQNIIDSRCAMMNNNDDRAFRNSCLIRMTK